MLTNKLVDILTTITAWIVVPCQIITTFILGILVRLTFGFLLFPFSFLWIVLFFGPLMGLSFLWLRIPFIRILISIIGIPLAVIANIYVCLLPSMGEKESRIVKMLYCQTFPYTFRLHQYYIRQLKITFDDDLYKIFQRVSKDIAIRQFLTNFTNENNA